MNGFTRFLCLIFGISVDGDAPTREKWAKRRQELGIDENDSGEQPPTSPTDGTKERSPQEAGAGPDR